jgi:hypothetical protein
MKENKMKDFNAYLRFVKHVDILRKGKEKQDDGEFLASILRDCSFRRISPESVIDKRILEPNIFYGLAGMTCEMGDKVFTAIARPSEFDISPPPKCSQSLYNIFGGSAMAEIGIYHQIRENINELQLRENISSITSNKRVIRGKLIRYLDYNDQMMLLDKDREILRSQVPKLVDFFRLISNGYAGFNELDDESLVPLIPGVLDVAMQESEYVWVAAESLNWTKSGDMWTGHYCHRYDPDRIRLEFTKWDTSNKYFKSFCSIIAKHPDKSRIPWE